jgi:hypothetical protein
MTEVLEPIDGVADNSHLLDQAAKLVTRNRERLEAQRALQAANGTREYLSTPEPATPAPARSMAPETANGKVVVPEAPAVDPIKADFKVFLTLVWRHLGLPDPTPIQLSMADYLQHGPRSSVIMAFRGAAKSWITAAFALWNLYKNPQYKVMVVSGSMKRAVAFTTFCLALIRDMPLLSFLEPSAKQRQSSTLFDVGPARPDQSASLSAFGITGQIVGQRADLIVGDDVETNTNSLTVMMREKLGEAIKEFDAILKPGGRIKFLGTPQTHDSIYNKLPARGYAVRIWPILYPDAKRIARYGDKLSPYIKNRSNPDTYGKTVEPTRFSKEEIDRQLLSYGSSGFDLQFMLDTSLSDLNRFPLKLHNLMVMSLEPGKAPEEVVWGKSDETALNHLPTMGFPGDKFYKPVSVSDRYSRFNTVKAIIDTSGEGEDETAISIGGELNARVFALWNQGWLDGSSPATLLAIAKLLVKFKVGYCRIESNYGGTMFSQLLRPVVAQEWAKWNTANPNQYGGTQFEDERAVRIQKELRIISDLEPATQSHRLIVSEEVIQFDYTDVMSRTEGDHNTDYSLFKQYTNLTRDRDSLPHDDRLETLAGLVGLYRDVLGVNPQAMAREREADALERELQALDELEDEATGGRSGPDPALSHRHRNQRDRVR